MIDLQNCLVEQPINNATMISKNMNPPFPTSIALLVCLFYRASLTLVVEMSPLSNIKLGKRTNT